MNKTAIKNYAIWARVNLIEAAKQRAYQYEITKDNITDAGADVVSGKPLTKEEKEQRRQLIDQINRKGFDQVMEEVAYTWFNRFIALRFMEVNGYLPSKIRVFTDSEGNFKPEILKEALTVELPVDKSRVMELLEKQDNEELYKMLLIAQCNELSNGLPDMFEVISNYTELLFPNNLLKEDSILGEMVNTIPEEDWTDAIQIIGWLYQYYNSELKDETFALLKKNVKISKERIPAATQLFTPDWIVRYMVENSLGRLWYEGHPNDEIKKEWKYYLDEAQQEPEVEEQLKSIREEYKTIKPEDIKVIDPCMGSGHILVYAFDVLMQIYTSAGWSERDAAEAILENNLYGLDIDDRAGQLAYFAVMMKARKYSRRILTKNIRPKVYSIQESNDVKFDAWWRFGAEEDIARRLLDNFNDAKEFGSVIKLSVSLEEIQSLNNRLSEIEELSDKGNLLDVIQSNEIIRQFTPIVDLAEVMLQKYHVVVTNPPYMSARGSMSAVLTKYLSKNYSLSKNDMFTVFMEVCQNLLRDNGLYSMVNQQSWMFLAGFAKLREKLYSSISFVNLLHIGAGAFEGIAGEVVQSVAFSVRKSFLPDYKASFLDETEGKWKECIGGIPSNQHLYNMSISEIKEIPNGILCYHLGGIAISQYYNGRRLDSFADPRVGMATGDNDLFVRLWQEVDFTNIGFGINSGKETVNREERWFPYNKGGECRRWYGNRTHLVDWYHDGSTITTFKQERLKRGEIEKKNSECWNREYYFLESISWSKVSSGRFAVRYYEPGFIFDVAGCSILGLGDNLKYVMGALNSELRNAYIESLSPTLNFETGAIKAFPIIIDDRRKSRVEELVNECIQIEKEEWDSYEGSWDFTKHPLVGVTGKIEDAFKLWENECNNRIERIQKAEKEINEIFIDIYGLQDELSTTIKMQDITLRKANLHTEIKSLISYAVGCMFGRYSLDVPGLQFAGGKWNLNKYSSFVPDKDGIIPICDDEYFEDDIVARFVRFIEVAFGQENLEENLRFIASVIGGSGTSRDIIRSYFINDFYADHCSTYSVSGSGKRPIYWLFDSGKKNSFKCLIYMHRYQPDTIARIRTDYIHEMQSRYQTAIEGLEKQLGSSLGNDYAKVTRQINKLKEQELELNKYEEQVHHIADQMIPIDLNDGVKANYAKFETVLAKIK